MEGHFPEQMKCPICFEIPDKEIFQCRNGHTLCNICSEKVTQCPQCRVNLEQSNKIRNRALEDLLDMSKFSCPFKEKGCNQKLGRGDIVQHSKICQFGGRPTPFCNIFGFDCDFQISTEKLNAAITHLRRTHKVLYKNGNFLQARFQQFQKHECRGTLTWAPVILKVSNIHLMLISSAVEDHIGTTCFSFDEKPKNFLVEFRYEAKSNQQFPDIKWLTSPICITKAEEIIRSPLHMTPINLLQDGYLKNNYLDLKIYVHGETFPCHTFQAMQSVDMEVEFTCDADENSSGSSETEFLTNDHYEAYGW